MFLVLYVTPTFNLSIFLSDLPYSPKLLKDLREAPCIPNCNCGGSTETQAEACCRAKHLPDLPKSREVSLHSDLLNEYCIEIMVK